LRNFIAYFSINAKNCEIEELFATTIAKMSLATKPFVIRIYNDTLNWTAL
jgi:hypothetical protein